MANGLRWLSALHTAILNQLIFTSLVLVIEVPLGVALAFALPRHGAGATFWIFLLALPPATPCGNLGDPAAVGYRRRFPCGR